MVQNGSEGLRQRANGVNATKLVISENGKQTDQRLDKHET
jgi:delta24(24(1))-sterol reductase